LGTVTYVVERLSSTHAEPRETKEEKKMNKKKEPDTKQQSGNGLL